jgi:hypothetical protein
MQDRRHEEKQELSSGTDGGEESQDQRAKNQPRQVRMKENAALTRSPGELDARGAAAQPKTRTEIKVPGCAFYGNLGRQAAKVRL